MNFSDRKNIILTIVSIFSSLKGRKHFRVAFLMHLNRGDLFQTLKDPTSCKSTVRLCLKVPPNTLSCTLLAVSRTQRTIRFYAILSPERNVRKNMS